MARPAATTPDPVAAHNRRLGERGETLAAQHLTRSGLVLLDRNWRCSAGEIDLVLRDGRVLVVCEVKTRSSTDYGSPFEAVTPTKVARLRRLAVRWVRDHDCRPEDIRIDMVSVLTPPGRPVEIEHVTGIG